jgi:hypothetical protein
MMSVKDETMIHDPNTASEVQMRIFAPLVGNPSSTYAI